MKYIPVAVLSGLLFLLGPVAAMAVPSTGEIDRLQASTQVFNEALAGIPAPVLANAQGIAIIPGEVKAGFIFGGELGQGVVVARAPNGSWSPPAFIAVAGGSFGLQIGAEARDVVLVFNSPRSVQLIENGRLDLGGDVSVAAGPIGAGFAVTTETPEVYAYVNSAGAFIGATVQGSVLSFNYGANQDFYGVSDPLSMRAAVIPDPARRFDCMLSSATGAPSKGCG
jgi:lipid-binding SYLF domain-containing protein